jgi:hypothetical protein
VEYAKESLRMSQSGLHLHLHLHLHPFETSECLEKFPCATWWIKSGVILDGERWPGLFIRAGPGC